MGIYGFVRIAMPMLPDTWRRYALVFIIVGVISVIYGALVAPAQTSFKRMIAYTSINHMGYILLAGGAAGTLSGTDTQARSLAVTGAVTQIVSHGLLTGPCSRSPALRTTESHCSTVSAAARATRNCTPRSGPPARRA